MPVYSTLNRMTLTQLYVEDRKQRAHLKKISDMQRRSRLDNREPPRLPQLHQHFVKHMNDKRQEIDKENDVKSRKLLTIMASKNVQPPPPFHPTNSPRRTHTVASPQTHAEYRERIAKAKGKYDAGVWKNQYEQHKEHLKLGKNNKVFTPLDIGINRQRMNKGNSSFNSKQTTPTSSAVNMFHRHEKN